MAVTIVSFRWLEILEKEFDKNFVDLDLLIGDLDGEEPDFVYSARQKLAGLSSCFAQLTHKAQTVFQNSAKIEAELIDLRTELINSKTKQEVLEEESRSLVLQLHSLQLDRLPSNQNPEQYKEKIETALKLSPSKNSYSEEITFRNNSEIKKLKNELLQYQTENVKLRNSILALHSEVYGARLAAKYLDKELAGRIQQLQLLGKDMRTDVKDKLWRQLESEILLHRHKTVIRACRNRTNQELIRPDSRIFSFRKSEQGFLKSDFIVEPELMFGLNLRKKEDGLFFNKSEPRYRVPPSEDRLHPSGQQEIEMAKSMDSREESGCQGKEDATEIGSSVKLIRDSANDDSNVSRGVLIPLESTGSNKEETEIEKTEEEKMEKELITNAENSEKKLNLEEDFSCLIGEKRAVMVKRQSGQGLGISITGGREHGVPILISELEVGGPAYECRNLYVGDAILKVNDTSLENVSHFEAVKVLTNLESNDVRLLVQFIAVDTDEENSLSEDLYGYRYRFFDTEVMDSSDALGLHPVHTNSAHTPTAPRTPDYCRSRDGNQLLRISHLKHSFDENCSLSDDQSETQKDASENPYETEEVISSKLIDLDTGTRETKPEQVKIDLFGFRFETDMKQLMTCETNDLMDDFLIKSEEKVEATADLIQIDDDPKSIKSETKFKFVDENIFSGLEDNSLLDNIVKSFSEDDFSYLENDKDRNATSDSGLEIYLSGSDLDLDKRYCEDRYRNNGGYLNEWMDNTPEKIELKTLHQIFDRSFSSNLSSPRGSTSFDDDILSTEHSDEKSNLANNFRNKMKDMKNAYNPKKIQKFYPKNMDMSDDGTGKSFKSESVTVLMRNNEPGKKSKRTSSESLKRSKNSRKVKENGRKESSKLEKRKNSKDSDPASDSHQTSETCSSGRKRETGYKMTDRFEENLIEYNVKNYDVEDGQLRDVKSLDPEKAVIEVAVADELEETRKLSRKYGLKIPGKVVKSEVANNNNRIVLAEGKSPEKCIKIMESNFKHFKPPLNGGLKAERDSGKAKVFRCNRYDSFGDPDFGTPV